VKRDSLGRRIGRNWWREYNWDIWFSATEDWLRRCETEAIGYATEEAEFRERNPRPTFKDCLVANAGLGRAEVM
jgi:hypothetical protein